MCESIKSTIFIKKFVFSFFIKIWLHGKQRSEVRGLRYILSTNATNEVLSLAESICCRETASSSVKVRRWSVVGRCGPQLDCGKWVGAPSELKQRKERRKTSVRKCCGLSTTPKQNKDCIWNCASIIWQPWWSWFPNDCEWNGFSAELHLKLEWKKSNSAPFRSRPSSVALWS